MDVGQSNARGSVRSGRHPKRLQFALWNPPPFPYLPPNTFASILAPPEIGGPFTYTETFAAIADGTIYAQINGYSYSLGPPAQVRPSVQYTIQLGSPDDYGNSAATAGALIVGGSVSGSLDVPNDVDKFAVTLEAGKTYEFDALSGPLFEIALYGTDTNNYYLAHWSPYHPPLTYTPDHTGTFYVGVYTQEGLGQYTIGAKLLEPPAPSAIQTGQSPAQSDPIPAHSDPIPAHSDPMPVYRFFDATNGTHFLTSNMNEASTLRATRPELTDEGVGFSSTSSSDPDAAPVFRFFDMKDGSHFFTADSSERDTILATRPDLAFEGTGFYEYKTQQPNSTPIYRIFDTADGTHFFTGSASEVVAIAAARPDLKSEGIAFFAPA